MRFRDGTVWQKALFATLIGVYVLGLADSRKSSATVYLSLKIVKLDTTTVV